MRVWNTVTDGYSQSSCSKILKVTQNCSNLLIIEALYISKGDFESLKRPIVLYTTKDDFERLKLQKLLYTTKDDFLTMKRLKTSNQANDVYKRDFQTLGCTTRFSHCTSTVHFKKWLSESETTKWLKDELDSKTTENKKPS